MFRCEITGEFSEPFEKPEMVVVQKRKKEYYGVKVRKGRGRPQRGQRRGPPVIEKIGEGWEIVKEVRTRRSVLARLEAEGKKIECKWS